MRDTVVFPALLFAAFILAVLAVDDSELQDGIPEKKLISTFQIVRFPNDACVGSNTRNGTCYTSAECSDKGGSSSGSCADGFGVCCVFVMTECGKSSSENITYWDAPTTSVRSTSAPTSCTLTICPTDENICQLRIDFKTFVINGPSTTTVSEHHRRSGMVPLGQTTPTADPLTAAGNSAKWTTNCLVDTFSVSGESIANTAPVICGTNTGYHMYVDANVNDCNMLAFQFSASTGISYGATTADTRGIGTLTTADWDMTVYQYACGAKEAAPPGCTQYFFGPITGRVTTYNYAGSMHLANQNQKICIRRERDYCYACFASDGIDGTFQISGTSVGQDDAHTYPGQPCGYNCELIVSNVIQGIGAANSQCSYDCVIIPGAFSIGTSVGVVIAASTTAANIKTLVAATAQLPVPPQIGGAVAFGIGIASGGDISTQALAGTAVQFSVCTKHVPFQLTFKSDGFEGTGTGSDAGGGGVNEPQPGFNLYYELMKCA